MAPVEPGTAVAVVASMEPMAAVANIRSGLVEKGRVLQHENSLKPPENYIQPEGLSINRQRFPQTPVTEEIMEALKQMDIRVLLV